MLKEEGIKAKIKRNKTKTAGVAELLIATLLGLVLNILGYSLSQVVLSLLGAGQWALSAPVWQTAFVSAAMAFALGGIVFLGCVLAKKLIDRGPEKPKTVSVKGLELLSKISSLEAEQGKRVIAIQFNTVDKNSHKTKTVTLDKDIFKDQINCKVNQCRLLQDINDYAQEEKEDLPPTSPITANPFQPPQIDGPKEVPQAFRKTKFTIRYKNPEAALEVGFLKEDAYDNIFDPKKLENSIIEHQKRGFIVSKIGCKKTGHGRLTFVEAQAFYNKNKKDKVKNQKIEKDTLSNIIKSVSEHMNGCDSNGKVTLYLMPPKGKKVARDMAGTGNLGLFPISHDVKALAAKELVRQGVKTDIYIWVGENTSAACNLKEASGYTSICGKGAGYESGSIRFNSGVTGPADL